ncbi:MAG: hypothetical protein E6Q98_00615 [Rhodospirillaceae bacterium]|nr:MAG: hypothetical protein E6Q98_00615 [Rhodospirillaceae bacterium]
MKAASAGKNSAFIGIDRALAIGLGGDSRILSEFASGYAEIRQIAGSPLRCRTDKMTQFSSRSNRRQARAVAASRASLSMIDMLALGALSIATIIMLLAL